MKNIIITGDVTADWNIARIERGPGAGQLWNDQDLTRACLQPGGAAMLGQLLREMFAGIAEFQVHGSELPEGLHDPTDKRVCHSYAMWMAAEHPQDKRKAVWRVERFLGLDPFCGTDTPCQTNASPGFPAQADIVVIDDAALRFRTHPELWPEAITAGKPTWIIVKMSHPVAEAVPGSLWNYLLEHHAQRTIVVTTITDLRKRSVRVSKGISWERTALELDWECRHNPAIASLQKCALAIVSLGTAGAYLFSQEGAASNGYLLYDPNLLEGDWGRNLKGYMVGYNVCLTAAVARQIALSPDIERPYIQEGIRQGVYLMRQLQREGYGQAYAMKGSQMSAPAFPASLLATHSREKDDYLCWRKIPVATPVPEAEQGKQTQADTGWRILNDICLDSEKEFDAGSAQVHYRGEPFEELYKLAARIVVSGQDSVLRDVPTVSYGNLVTADRQEIEDYRRIAASIEAYCNQPLGRPLCLAVFGAPGSGKSFGVKQVAKSVSPDRIQNITFNLTQFTQMKDLIDALHQVRDIGLSGKVPLVFWDEFDTQECEWLKNFLAPMQDGEFQDGQITYHIGPAIFVFAGGTSSTYEHFGETLGKDDPQGRFQLLKGPDFLSRLHNFLNVKGPNQVTGQDPACDLHLIRRAILLRSLLERHARHLFRGDELNIDPDVLRAFLKVKEYYHGARSMESIISMSLSGGRNSFNKSMLPPLAQLDIHVNGGEFMFHTEGQIFRRNDMDNALLNIFAAGVHQVYCEGAETWKTEAALKTFEDLDDGLKEENRRHVQDIINKLERIGFIIERAAGSGTVVDLPAEAIEPLAEMEHTRWMKSKANMGWVYAPIRDNEHKKHPCLLPWRELTDGELGKTSPELAAVMGRTALPEEEKEKDRVLVRAIPRILAMAGYVLKKL